MPISPSTNSVGSTKAIGQATNQPDGFNSSFFHHPLTPCGPRTSILRAFSKSNRLGQFTATRSIAWCNHGIVGGQAPFRPVFVRRHVELTLQIPLQHFQLFPVLEANQIVVFDRGSNRNGRHWCWCRSLDRPLAGDSGKCCMHAGDQVGQIADRDAIVANLRCDHISGQRDQIVGQAVFHCTHFKPQSSTTPNNDAIAAYTIFPALVKDWQRIPVDFALR